MDQFAVIVDVDGTIWDSLPFYARTLADCTNTDASDHLAALRDGQSIVTLVNRTPGIGRARFGSELVARATEMILYPTVTTTLEAAHDRNLRFGILTSLPGWIVTALLDGTQLTGFFNGVVHASNCKARKPSPLAFSAAAAALGLSPKDRVIYVGDRDVDARTAWAAGVPFAWASYGYGTNPPDGDHTPIRQFSEVLDL